MDRSDAIAVAWSKDALSRPHEPRLSLESKLNVESIELSLTNERPKESNDMRTANTENAPIYLENDSVIGTKQRSRGFIPIVRQFFCCVSSNHYTHEVAKSGTSDPSAKIKIDAIENSNAQPEAYDNTRLSASKAQAEHNNNNYSNPLIQDIKEELNASTPIKFDTDDVDEVDDGNIKTMGDSSLLTEIPNLIATQEGLQGGYGPPGADVEETYHYHHTRRRSSMESLPGDLAESLCDPEDIRSFLGDCTVENEGKICCVIDLDETLVHSSFDFVENCDFTVEVEVEGELHTVYVLKRPFVDAFLRAISDLFECVLFTASLSKYADPVTDQLDPSHSLFQYRLFREQCVFFQGSYVKNLHDLGRDINRIVILDNSPICYAYHPGNAVPIVSWFNDPADRVLWDMIPYFQNLAKCDDVHDFIRDNCPPGLENIQELAQCLSGPGTSIFARPLDQQKTEIS